MKQKILHQHLIKCGGTSLNNFLASKYPAERALDAASAAAWLDSLKAGKGNKKGDILSKDLADFRFSHYDCVYGHNPLLWAAPDEFFKITVLRNPIDRVFSQIRDWQRLKPEDISRGSEENKKFKEYARNSSIANVVKEWERAPISRLNLSNMQTRLLGLSLDGVSHVSQERDWSSNDGLNAALNAIKAYDIVGTTENLNLVMRALCYKMHWCPPEELFALNTIKGEDDKDKDTLQLLRRINKNDLYLYDEAREKESDLREYCSYSIDDFERLFASERVKSLSPVFLGGRDFYFDFNMPLIGSGFWPRDSGNLSNCAVWTGPSNSSSFFVPCISGASLRFKIGIKGFVKKNYKKLLEIYVDGERKEYFYTAQDGQDVAIMDHLATRNFMRIDLKIPEAIPDAHDKRKRGVSLSWYGYTLKH